MSTSTTTPASSFPEILAPAEPRAERAARIAARLHIATRLVARWGLVAILLGFGAYKFTAVEAASIQPLVANSPLMSWMYELGSIGAVSAVIGVTEIAVGLALALHLVSPRIGVAGGIGAIVTFAVTLSFLFTTPGALKSAGMIGFVGKDLFLLGAALTATAESLLAMATRARVAR